MAPAPDDDGLRTLLKTMTSFEDDAEAQLIGGLLAQMFDLGRGFGALSVADVISEILFTHPWWVERPDYAMAAYSEILCGYFAEYLDGRVAIVGPMGHRMYAVGRLLRVEFDCQRAERRRSN